MNNESEKNEMFRDIYKSSLRASYFGAMQNPDFVKKSAMHIKNIKNIE